MGTSVEYTPEDEKGFYFRPMKADTYQAYLQVHKTKRKTRIIMLVILLLLGVLADKFILPDHMDFYLQIYYLIVIIVLGAGIQLDSSNIRLFKKGVALEFEVEIVEKYKAEDATSLGPGEIINHSKLHPILARDTTTGYESVCYIPKEQYLTCAPGQVLTLERFKKK